MKFFYFFFFIFFLLIFFFECSIINYQEHKLEKNDSEDLSYEKLSEAHFFTEYLNKNNLEDAKAKGLVNLIDSTNFTSYSGYFTVNKKCKNNLFSWFFKQKNPNSPVILWLGGGPGSSSLFSLFVENGPYYIDKNLNLNLRKIAWTNKYSVLYIDSPVGTGFSYTNSDDFCYAKNQDQVSQDLYELLIQFFKIFNDLNKNDFYITGHSYAGKYVPYLANKIHQNKDEATKYFNFVGIAVADGLIDPINQLDYGLLLWELGMIDLNQFIIMEKKKVETIELIKNQSWLEAFNGINELVEGDLGTISLYKNFTGLTNYFNFLTTEESEDQFYYKDFLVKSSTREKIHVGNNTYHNSTKVEIFMREDIPKSVLNEFITVISNYKTLLFNGQLDIIVAPILTINFLDKMPWIYKDQFKNSPKKIWRIDNETQVAGYIKSYKNLHFAVVRNAGHILTYDQPKASYDLITKFIENKLN